MPAILQVNRARVVTLRHISKGAGDPTPEAWKRHLADQLVYADAEILKIEPRGASTIEAAKGGWVGAVRAPRSAPDLSRSVVLKVRPLVSPWARLKALIGAGRADRHVRGAGLLALAKIPTARTLASGLLRVDGVLCEFVAMERLEGPTLLEVIADANAGRVPVGRQHELARCAGELVGELARNRLFNRDHKPSNIIVLGHQSEIRPTDGTSVPPSSRSLAVIDPVGVRRDWSGTGADDVWEMTAKMYIEALGCGVAPRVSLCMRALTAVVGYEYRDRGERSRVLRESWALCASIVEAHGDPRPKVNPLEGSDSR